MVHTTELRRPLHVEYGGPPRAGCHSVPSEPPGKLISNFSAHSSLSVPNTVDQFQKDSPTLQGNQLPFRKTMNKKAPTIFDSISLPILFSKVFYMHSLHCLSS